MNAEGAASKTTQRWYVCHFGTRSPVIWKATGRRQRGSVRVSLQICGAVVDARISVPLASCEAAIGRRADPSLNQQTRDDRRERRRAEAQLTRERVGIGR